MRLQVGLMFLLVTVSLALVGLIHTRKKDEVKEQKHTTFQLVKFRAIKDLLREYQKEEIKGNELLEEVKEKVKVLETELSTLESTVKRTSEVEACQGTLKHTVDEVMSIEHENANFKTAMEKEKSGWAAEVASLKQQVEQRSKVCDFVKKDSEEGRKLCGDKVIKAEAPKQEEPKADPPKADPPKADPPKADSPPKADVPKQEEPKAEAPKSR